MKHIILAFLIAISLAPAAGCSHEESSSMGTATETKKEVSHYTCPMHPEVHENHPGQCPKCGMNLESVTK